MAVEPAPDLARVIEGRDFPALHEMLKSWSPPTAANLLETLPVEQQVVAFRVLPRDLAADVFEYLPLEAQQSLLKAMAREDVAKILNEMAPDDRTALLDELPGTVTQHLLQLLTPEERSVAVKLLGYPEGSIGRLVTPDYVRVRPDWDMAYVLDHIRRYGQDSETLSIVYVIDDRGRLVGEIPIRKILLLPPETRVSEVTDQRVVALKATDTQESAVPVFQSEDRVALPVVDSGGTLIGIVTVDDVLDVAQSAATRTLQRFGGMQALDEPYLEMPFHAMLRRRASWLVVLFLGEMLTATAMAFFEKEIQRAVVLALFVPLIISSGGNSGSQAATLVIRALALGEVSLGQWWRVMRREVWSGLVPGQHSRRDRLPAHLALVPVLRSVRAALVPRRGDGGRGAGRHRALGNLRGIHAPARAEAPRIRSGHLLGAVRRDAGGRHRAGDLLQRGGADPAGHAPLAARARAVPGQGPPA